MIHALVIAGNYQQFIWWIRENKLYINDYKYIKRREDYIGFRDIPIFLVGEYWKSPLNPIEVANLINPEKEEVK